MPKKTAKKTNPVPYWREVPRLGPIFKTSSEKVITSRVKFLPKPWDKQDEEQWYLNRSKNVPPLVSPLSDPSTGQDDEITFKRLVTIMMLDKDGLPEVPSAVDGSLDFREWKLRQDLERLTEIGALKQSLTKWIGVITGIPDPVFTANDLPSNALLGSMIDTMANIDQQYVNENLPGLVDLGLKGPPPGKVPVVSVTPAPNTPAPITPPPLAKSSLERAYKDFRGYIRGPHDYTAFCPSMQTYLSTTLYLFLVTVHVLDGLEDMTTPGYLIAKAYAPIFLRQYVAMVLAVEHQRVKPGGK